jgi:hypothetical protein
MKTLLLPLIVIQVLLVAAYARGQGTFIYDQQSATETNGAEGAPVIQSNQPFGQSFIPSLSSVGFIRLWLGDVNQNNGLRATVYVNLRSNSITGPVISSTDPVSMPDTFGRGTNGYINFFFTTPVALTPGTPYYFQPVVQSGDLWTAAVDMQYTYAAGTAFFLGQPAPNFDLWFREGVTTPEPSSLVFFLCGAAILTYALRSHSRRQQATPKSP